MDEGLGNIEVFYNHFEAFKTPEQTIQAPSSSTGSLSRSQSRLWSGRRIMTAQRMLKFFSFRGLPWSAKDENEKIEISIAELESLRTEISDAEEREAYLRAQLEHIDELLKSAQLSGYLYIRTRWTELPGEPPILDDADIDDWLPRFVVLHGSCVFFYLQSTDLSPHDTTLLADVVEIGRLPSFSRDEQTHYAFFILTSHGLRFECSTSSEVQVNSWLSTLRKHCKSDTNATLGS